VATKRKRWDGVTSDEIAKMTIEERLDWARRRRKSIHRGATERLRDLAAIDLDKLVTGREANVFHEGTGSDAP
jgi:hypothetical protein